MVHFPKIIAFPDAKGYQLININEALYFKAEGNYTKVFLKGNRSFLITKSLKEIHDRLEPTVFVRIHNSYIVNLNHTNRYCKGDGGYLILSTNKTIPVSRNKRNLLINHLKNL
jgi:two-component system LytT family response regulator